MSKHIDEHWGSRWGFLMAAAGSAIGLGNIWKFPYITGMNGGGAFVLVYLLCVFFVGFPLMVCEFAMGRKSQSDAIGAFQQLSSHRTFLADFFGGMLLLTGICLVLFSITGYGCLLIIFGALILKYGWTLVGIMSGVIVPVLICGYYGVISGWILLYIYKAFTGSLTFTDKEGAAQVIGTIVNAPPGSQLTVILAQAIFWLICGAILWMGVKKGIERWSKILMPLLFLLLVVLILRSVSLPGAMAGVKFFLAPDFSKLTGHGVLIALGHAFFSLSLAMGIMITYGSYVKKDEDLTKSAVMILGLDTLASILGGLAVFPAVYAMGFEAGQGPALIFNILPAAFNLIPGGLGWLWNGLFFVAFLVAALTSAISLAEVVIAIGINHLKLSRKVSVTLFTVGIILLGWLCALSMNNWDNLPGMQKAIGYAFNPIGGSLFDLIDMLTANWMLPLGGIAIAIFVGWDWGIRNALKELRKGAGNELDTNLFILLAGLRGEEGYGDLRRHILTPASLWGFFVRFITPFGVLLAFMNAVGILK